MSTMSKMPIGSMVSLGVLAILCWFAVPVQAFGAGNIASISVSEGINWRHGDIEDILLTLTMSASLRSRPFDALHVKRVYFGNWLRDYSQVVDVGSLKYVDKNTIRTILWVLSFMAFGYATGEFEVTEERLGCYRPEEHIDNPKGYPSDAQYYDPRFRGPVDERLELAVDPETGMKNYIANERVGIMTSANFIRRTLGRSIELARSYAKTKNKKEKYEALRLLGTGLHCLEDFAAHSNYVELALRELGELTIFPHVGVATQGYLHGKYLFPLTTGTFGGVDLLHTVLGEASDKIVQSEIQQLENSISASANAAAQDGGEGSIVRNLLSMIPSGLLGAGGDEDVNSSGQKKNTSDLSAEAMSLEARAKRKQETGDDGTGADLTSSLYSIMEFHDTVSKAINRAIESIPGLSALMENLTESVSIFVFSLLAPYLMPLLSQFKGELTTASSEVISEAKADQHVIFSDPSSSDPTHSMLAKDHFTNRLNEPAGRVAREVVRYVVPLMMQAWDDESIDIGVTMNHIVAILHHPSLRLHPGGHHPCREVMFEEVRKWWQDEKSEQERNMLRDALSALGVQAGRNHKEGHDTGSGCAGHGPITKMATTHKKDKGKKKGGVESTMPGGAGGLLGAFGSLFGGEGDAKPVKDKKSKEKGEKSKVKTKAEKVKTEKVKAEKVKAEKVKENVKDKSKSKSSSMPGGFPGSGEVVSYYAATATSKARNKEKGTYAPKKDKFHDEKYTTRPTGYMTRSAVKSSGGALTYSTKDKDKKSKDKHDKGDDKGHKYYEGEKVHKYGTSEHHQHQEQKVYAKKYDYKDKEKDKKDKDKSYLKKGAGVAAVVAGVGGLTIGGKADDDDDDDDDDEDEDYDDDDDDDDSDDDEEEEEDDDDDDDDDEDDDEDEDESD